jgi:uncharacterized Zn-binding protein involved in type VI secretion
MFYISKDNMGNYMQTSTDHCRIVLLITFAMSLMLITGSVIPAVAESSLIQESEVEVGGSTVTIDGGDAAAIGVAGIPDDYYPVEDIGDGTLQQGDNGVFWQTGGTVSFTLTPPDSAEPGDTVSFGVKLGSQDAQTVTLEVVDPGTFDFGVELQGETTASVDESATITAYPNNNADTAVSDTTLDLLVDTNNDGEFTASEVVDSQTLDFTAGEYRPVNLTYSNIQLTPGDYTYQARISKDGQTTTSYSTGTLTVSDNTEQPSSPGSVVEETVSVGGSTVTIDGGSVNAIGVAGIPDGYYPVDDIGDGKLQQVDNGVIWQTGGTVSFTLTPPDSAEDGDTVSFDVKLGSEDAQTVSLEVVSNVPSDLPEGISANQYLAVAGDDGEINTFDLVDAIDGAADDGTYNGAELSTFDLIDLIEYNAE